MSQLSDADLRRLCEAATPGPRLKLYWPLPEPTFGLGLPPDDPLSSQSRRLTEDDVDLAVACTPAVVLGLLDEVKAAERDRDDALDTVDAYDLLLDKELNWLSAPSGDPYEASPDAHAKVRETALTRLKAERDALARKVESVKADQQTALRWMSREKERAEAAESRLAALEGAVTRLYETAQQKAGECEVPIPVGLAIAHLFDLCGLDVARRGRGEEAGR